MTLTNSLPSTVSSNETGVELSQSLQKFGHHFQLEADTHYRMSNRVISNLLQMSPDSWRVYESIVKELDLYPNDLIQDDKFLMDFYAGKVSIPNKFRTVRLKAKDYIKTYNLTDSNGYREFTLNALSLFEEQVTQFSFDPRQELNVKITHPISEITFHTQIQKSDGERVLEAVEHAKIRRKGDNTDTSKIWSAAEITFTLNENLALHMLLLRDYFTRIERKSAERLSKAAVKLYTLILMFKGSHPATDGAWMFQLNLDQCNALMSTNYKTITQFCQNFRLPNELNQKTDLDVHFSKDERTKIGKKYTTVNIFFSEKSAIDALKIGVKKKVTRKLKMRPRCLPGSDMEGKWARENLKILRQYEAELKEQSRVLPKADRERMANYKKIIGE